jgi:acyl carrier protein
MNSLVIMKLMAFVEERYGVALSFKQLTPDNLQTVRSIAKMIVAAGSNNE